MCMLFIYRYFYDSYFAGSINNPHYFMQASYFHWFIVEEYNLLVSKSLVYIRFINFILVIVSFLSILFEAGGLFSLQEVFCGVYLDSCFFVISNLLFITYQNGLSFDNHFDSTEYFSHITTLSLKKINTVFMEVLMGGKGRVKEQINLMRCQSF